MEDESWLPLKSGEQWQRHVGGGASGSSKNRSAAKVTYESCHSTCRDEGPVAAAMARHVALPRSTHSGRTVHASLIAPLPQPTPCANLRAYCNAGDPRVRVT